MTTPPAARPAGLEDALATLRWQLALGADAALEENPLPLGAALPSPSPAPNPGPSHSPGPSHIYSQASPAPAAPPAPVHHDLAKISSLEELRSAIGGLTGLGIRETAMNLVFGEGALHPPVMLIGEAPGEEEDRSGRPFVGRAGQLLEKMLAAIGLKREQVYITNLLPWRPPGNRTPKADEIATCLPYLMRHIELVQPKLLLLLGGPSAKALLGKDESVTRLRGTWWDYHSPGLGESVPVLVTYHPAYLLRTPAQKRESWRDLRLLNKKIGAA